MGQQQLLLVILVTIIVGIATVVAINTFSNAADSANLDAVRNDLAQIAASAQGYYLKPEMLGGGGNDFDDITFNNITFASTDISTNGLTAENDNGCYVIVAPSSNAQNVVVNARPSSEATPGTPCAGGDIIIANIGPNNMAVGGLGVAGTPAL